VFVEPRRQVPGPLTFPWVPDQRVCREGAEAAGVLALRPPRGGRQRATQARPDTCGRPALMGA